MNFRFHAILALALVSLSCGAVRRSSSPSVNELTPRSSPVQVGEMAPNFTLEDQHNQKVELAATRGKMPTVLVFYRGYW